ncbi:GNAT family N-acetyltransferase [Kordiimonas gwangyangensis]|uniref:GNAT family N-acetyltransferase n=1 Tax=Kordiimonas gwangyangensis TaxID=288022 RepID=UPI00035D8C7C|nr:GNAT family N-acetyltransferase [Kordiimonas gwangyangensis]
MTEHYVDTIETERLILREATLDDTAFVYALYNDPAFKQFVGDRGVHSLDDAANYISNNFIGSYRKNGKGLLVATLKDSGEPIGCCGLVVRPTFDVPDIGFAYLPDYTSKGYGHEAAAATMAHARNVLGLDRLLALVSPDNVKSIGLLKKLGFVFDRQETLPGNDYETQIFTYSA